MFLLTYLFVGGMSPGAPFPDCGPDPTDDALGCSDVEDQCDFGGPLFEPSVALVPFFMPSDFPGVIVIVIDDVDGNGTADIICGGHLIDDTTLYWIPGNGDGTFEAEIEIHDVPGTGPTQSIWAGDIDGDGDLDIVTDRATYVASGAGAFVTLPPLGGSPVELVDLDHDGVLDFISGRPGAVGIRLGLGGGLFDVETLVPVSAPWDYGARIVARDLDLDGHVDIAADTALGIAAFLGAGDGTMGPQIWTVANGTELTLGNIDLDGILDAVIVQPGTFGEVHVHLGNGDGTFAPSTSELSVGLRADAAIGDLDLDGKPDVAAAALSLGVAVHLGHGDGTFEPDFVAPFEPGGVPVTVTVALADMDDDGDLDVISGAYDFFGGIGHVDYFENRIR